LLPFARLIFSLGLGTKVFMVSGSLSFVAWIRNLSWNGTNCDFQVFVSLDFARYSEREFN